MSVSGVFRALLLLIAVVEYLLAQYGTNALPLHVTQACGADGRNATEFASNSAYQFILSDLLRSLSAQNESYRVNRDFNSTIYVQSLCRGDVLADDCQDCVVTASRDIVRTCARVRWAIIWYDECMLWYSQAGSSTTMYDTPRLLVWNTTAGSVVNGVKQLLIDVASDLGGVTENFQSSRELSVARGVNFATREKKLTGLQTMYALAQCIPALSSFDCHRCLTTGINELAESPSLRNQGGKVLMPSCNIRYELYPFYNPTANGTAAAAPPPREKNKISSTTVAAIVVSIAVCVVLLFIGSLLLRSRARKKHEGADDNKASINGSLLLPAPPPSLLLIFFGLILELLTINASIYLLLGSVVMNEITTADSLQFDWGTIEAATRQFSASNKIGRGGFGAVYKGTLSNEQEIAVKRLSKSSGQGEEEFKNEVVLVVKLQHKHLIKLLGFCLKGEEKILVYEFAPNKSLDYFLFDPSKRGQLNWSRRYMIIRGIARGILYLHEDSRLRIIHRDLKASNILLDAEMKPKISDFGLARLFNVNQTEGNTSKIVGTYGYMSPEYAMYGHFSVKPDVFSFGVLVLEIISGKKNSNFYLFDGANDLLSYAWNVWRDGEPLELLDPTLGETYTGNEVLRCFHISLLCVQDDETERPTMATVVHMLSSDSICFPMPKQPAFFVGSVMGSDFPAKGRELGHSSKPMQCSMNDVSITELRPR